MPWRMMEMAGVTGLEPAASGVTGQRSNRLSYTPGAGAWWRDPSHGSLNAGETVS